MLKGSILQKLEASHQDPGSGKRPLSFGVYYKNTLVALCHALEDCILTSNTAPLVVAAFQRGKWFLQEADRYNDLAQKSRQVVIMAAPEAGFAEHQTSQRENVELVQLGPEDPVAQEWHLIISAPSYTAMVLCQELSDADYGPDGPPREDQERKFYGFWTFEAELVQEAMDLAIAHVGDYNSPLQARLQAQMQAITQEAQTTQIDDLHKVVSRVVDYLQTSQQALPAVSGEDRLNNNLVSNELQAFLRLAQLVDLADAENPKAAAEVTALAEMMAQLLDLPAWQIQRLRLASQLHRIGALQAAESALVPSQTQEEAYCPLACPLVPGAQVLRTMSRLEAIAQIVTHLNEWWDGSGQPAGLGGDEIPLESRILGLVATFQQRVVDCPPEATTEAEEDDQLDQRLDQALAQCQAEQGDRWDPKLVETLTLIVSGLQQGLDLSIKIPKIAAGMWLLDPPQTQSSSAEYSAKAVASTSK